MIIKTAKILLNLLLVISIMSCTSSPPPAATLKIGIYMGWPTSGAAFIAQEKGLFTKYGVQVTLVPITEYVDIKKSYKEGKIDFAYLVLPDAIMFETEGVPTHFVYAADYSDSADVIVGRSSLNSLSDLKGKKVAFEGFNSFSHFMVLKLLEQAGLKEGEFQTANIENAKVLEALETGEIDAGHVYSTAISDALAKGYKVIEKAGKLPYLILDGWVVRADIIEAHPKEVQAVVNALAEATNLLARSPEESVPMMAEPMSIYHELHIFTLQENKEAFKSDGLVVKGGKEIVDFFYQKGVLVKLPDLNNVIDGQFAAAAKIQP
jgi:NitT/TauT family transport system substrate-binding protein